MNIGIVTTWFERGGAYVSRQYREVLQGPHRVFVYARGGEKRAKNDPRWADGTVTWARPSPVRVSTSFDLAQFRGWIRERALDLVFFNEQHWWPPVMLCSDMGVRTGAYVDYYTEATVPAFGCYDFLVCNTKRHHSVFRWHPQAFYVPWGTDTRVFSPAARGARSSGPVTFFHSAGCAPQRKGTDLLLQAFAGIALNARLVVHTQVPLEGEAAALADRLQREGRLQVELADVGPPGLYHRGDVYVYPSRLDGVGLTVAEALACGLPVIATDAPPMNEFVTADVGWLVRVERQYARGDGYYWPLSIADVDDLRRAMHAVAERPEALPATSRRAREYALAELDWRTNAAGLPDLFRGARAVDEQVKQRGREAARRLENERTDRMSRLALESPVLYRVTRWILRRFGKRYI